MRLSLIDLVVNIHGRLDQDHRCTAAGSCIKIKVKTGVKVDHDRLLT